MHFENTSREVSVAISIYFFIFVVLPAFHFLRRSGSTKETQQGSSVSLLVLIYICLVAAPRFRRSSSTLKTQVDGSLSLSIYILYIFSSIPRATLPTKDSSSVLYRFESIYVMLPRAQLAPEGVIGRYTVPGL